jgi:hypothetical protein
VAEMNKKIITSGWKNVTKKTFIQAIVLAIVFGFFSLVYGLFHTTSIGDHVWHFCAGFLVPFIVDMLRPVIREVE